MKTLLYMFAIILGMTVSTLAGDDHDHGPPIGKDVANLPIFDAHIHYKAEAWGPYPPEEVMRLMDDNKVAMGLVSSTPDEGTIKLWEHAPNRIVPELRPYHGDWDSSNWMDAPDMDTYIDERLTAHPHEGIGEFHVRELQSANRSLLERIADKAKARSIPIHIHSDDGPVRLLYEIEPDLTIIWAHAGMTSPPDVIMEMFETYPTLYADTSYREGDIMDFGGIRPSWRELLMRFPDRLMVGTDTWINGQWARYDRLIGFNRVWLSHLPRKHAEMIAYKNAEKLFGRKVSLDQIGTQ